MDYKKYKEALERAKIWQKHLYEVGNKDYADELNYIFPELRESEDERIKKEIVDFIKHTNKYGSNEKCESWLAWLEKQKAIDVLDEEEREFADNVDSYRKDMDEFYKKGYNAGREAEKQYWLEKQGEKKETLCDKCKKAQPSHSCQDITALGRCYIDGMNTSNKIIEPKFKVGDWVAIKEEIGLCTPLHIVDMDDKQYRVEQIDGSSGTPNIDYLDRLYHLWTIEDAKDGEVLVNGSNIFIFHFINDTRLMGYCHINTDMISLVLVLSANYFSKRVNEYGLW